MQFESVDLPRHMYPIQVEFIAEDFNTVVHTATIPGPGVLRVPPLSQQYGPIRVRVTYGNGAVEEAVSS